MGLHGQARTPRPIPPSGYPLPRARRRHNRHSCPQAGIHPPSLLYIYMPAPLPARMVRQAHHERAEGARAIGPSPQPFLRKQESISGARGRPRPIPPDVPPSFLRKQESILFRGHDDAPTVIPAPKQESIPSARPTLPTTIPASEQESIPSAGTTTPQPSFLPPSRNPSLPRARRRPNRHSCPRAGIHPSRGHDDAPTVIPAPEQESIPPHAHPQILVNNPQLTPIHFLTCVVEFPIGYGFSIAHSQNGPLEHVAMAR